MGIWSGFDEADIEIHMDEMSAERDERLQQEVQTHGQNPAIEAMRGWLSDCYWTDMDPEDFEPEFETTTEGGLFIQIEKLGGGTVGREYAGTWRYVVSNDKGQELARAQDCETGQPHTHAWVAHMLADYFTPEV